MGVCTIALLWRSEDNLVVLFSPLTFIWVVVLNSGDQTESSLQDQYFYFFIIIINIVVNNLQHHELFQGFYSASAFPIYLKLLFACFLLCFEPAYVTGERRDRSLMYQTHAVPSRRYEQCLNCHSVRKS